MGVAALVGAPNLDVIPVVIELIGPPIFRLPALPSSRTSTEHRAVLTDDLRSLAMPIWLAVALLPFIFVVMAACEAAFLQSTSATGQTHARRCARSRSARR